MLRYMGDEGEPVLRIIILNKIWNEKKIPEELQTALRKGGKLACEHTINILS